MNAALEIVRLLRSGAGGRLIRKGARSLRDDGLSLTWHRAVLKLRFGFSHARMARQPLFTEAELGEQRAHRFPRKIKFSVVVPLYNTPERFLREMIASVQAQTYGDWELCMADGSDPDRDEVRRVCAEYAEADERVRYRRLERNLGISGNLNAGLELATGDYIALLDHDDLLHPAALHEVMKAVCDRGADFVYTDEAVFESPDSRNIIDVHFKPDYAPDDLRANNYICHLSAFSRTLLEAAGPFDSAFDGSQDHDMILRLTEKAKRVGHIPEILYYWRAHAASVAGDIAAKDYAAQAGIRAVGAALDRAGWPGSVGSSPVFPAIYRIRYALRETPLISVVIPALHSNRAAACAAGVLERSSYPNYEIILVADDEKPYEALAGDPRLRILPCDPSDGASARVNRGAEAARGGGEVPHDARRLH